MNSVGTDAAKARRRRWLDQVPEASGRRIPLRSVKRRLEAAGNKSFLEVCRLVLASTVDGE